MPTNTTTLPRLYSPEEIAQQTGLPVRNIRDAMYYRRLPVHKVGRRVYATAEAVNAWISGTNDEGDR